MIHMYPPQKAIQLPKCRFWISPLIVFHLGRSPRDARGTATEGGEAKPHHTLQTVQILANRKHIAPYELTFRYSSTINTLLWGYAYQTRSVLPSTGAVLTRDTKDTAGAPSPA